MNTTAGGFLDFLIAITTLVLILQAHKLAKHFLDQLFPGGGGSGPGALISGLMEGIGMTAGSKALGLTKKGLGMAASGGMGGLASALRNAKNADLFGNDSVKGMGGAFKSPRRSPSVLGDDERLPASEPMALPGPEGSNDFGSGGPTASDEGNTGSSSGTATDGTSSFSMPRHSSTSSSGANVGDGLFDATSKQGGAYLKLRPSARNKIEELAQLPANSEDKAFAIGAGQAIKGHVNHALEKGNLRGSGIGGIMNNGNKTLGQYKDATERDQMVRDSYVPTQNLLKAARKNDPMAMSDLERIGGHQQEMEDGMTWMERGQTLQQSIQPEYDQAQKEYDDASQEVDGIGFMMDQYRSQGATNAPEYKGMEASYQRAVERQSTAKTTLDTKQEQMNRAKNMTQRGERRVISAQNSISQINMGWYPENKRSSARMVQAAQDRANRVTLSDLGQSPGMRYQGQRRNRA